MLELRPTCEHCNKPLPARNWKDGNFLGKDPAGSKVKHRPVDIAAHARYAAPICNIPSEKR